MEFPSDLVKTVADALAAVRACAGQIKRQAQAMIDAPSITRKQVLDYANSLADNRSMLDVNAVVPGLAEYAQSQFNDPAFDIVAKYGTMYGAIDAVQAWIVASYWKDGNGNLVVYAFDANKRFANINMTVDELAAFKAQLATITATIS